MSKFDKQSVEAMRDEVKHALRKALADVESIAQAAIDALYDKEQAEAALERAKE